MEVSEQTRIARLMRRFSGVEELIGWYGIDTEDIGAGDTVQELAWAHRVDVDDLIADLQAIVDDESNTAERDPDEDEEDDDEDDVDSDDEDEDEDDGGGDWSDEDVDEEDEDDDDDVDDDEADDDEEDYED